MSDDKTFRVKEVAVIVELGLARDVETEVSFVLTVDCLREVSVRGFGKLTLFIEQVNDARGA